MAYLPIEMTNKLTGAVYGHHLPQTITGSLVSTELRLEAPLAISKSRRT